jgi:mannose-6-phosphate isomerase-like protein (cupin superfamily)
VSKYTVLNLKEVTDQAHNFGYHDGEFELRMARVPLECENSGVSYMRISPNFRSPHAHRHKVQEEVFVLVSGSGRIKLDDDIVELEPWTAVRVARETVRCLEGGPDGAEVICIGAPNTGPGDGESVHAWWTD